LGVKSFDEFMADAVEEQVGLGWFRRDGGWDSGNRCLTGIRSGGIFSLSFVGVRS
jgi:hypothetical protein